MEANNNLDRSVIPPLTGIRACAAYLVFFHHFNLPWFKFLQNEMHIGVGMFYVLSGFLITYRYRVNYQIKANWFAKYFKNRFARIYPLYFILLLLTLLIHKEFSFKELFFNLTLTKGFFDPRKFTGIAQAWSLTVEECFYALAPWLFLLYDRKKSFLWLFAP